VTHAVSPAFTKRAAGLGAIGAAIPHECIHFCVPRRPATFSLSKADIQTPAEQFGGEHGLPVALMVLCMRADGIHPMPWLAPNPAARWRTRRKAFSSLCPLEDSE
jgi:hypothetical protein